jgi:hypothetical protein
VKRITIIIFFLSPVVLLAQFGVGFHQSNLPFATFNFEFKERFRPELRIGVDYDLVEVMPLEAVLLYDLLNKEEYEFYAGGGIWTDFSFTGVAVPIGLNIYPFATKAFGFHIELTPILNETSALRGSWGIRYRFMRGKG